MNRSEALKVIKSPREEAGLDEEIIVERTEGESAVQRDGLTDAKD